MIECWLSTPDANTAERTWVLRIGMRRIRLPIRYSAHNRRWVRFEKWLERKFWKRFDVGY